MERFKILNSLGDGSFGQVFRVQDWETGEICAMKKFKHKYLSREEAMSNLEVTALVKLQHPNVVQLKKVIYYE